METKKIDGSLLTVAANTPWTILCPGPSIKKFIPGQCADICPWRAIAVNGAINTDYPVKYWAVGDIECFDACVYKSPGDRFLNGAPDGGPVTMWVAERWIGDMSRRNNYPASLFKQLRKRMYPYRNYDDLAESMPFGHRLHWREFTMLTAVALAVKCSARKINIYGADMCGQEYFEPGYLNDKTNLSEQRWCSEIEAFEEIRLECRRNNIIVERICAP